MEKEHRYFPEGSTTEDIHKIIGDQPSIPDEYVMGKLSEEDKKIFEDHFISCRKCMAEIELSEEMIKGFSALTQDKSQELFGELL